MDNAIHAQLMASHCVPRIAQLVVRVPSEECGGDSFQTQLISSLVHGSLMSNNCKYAEAKEMMYAVTERLFTTASPEYFDVQNQAHMLIVGMASHASQMGTTTPDGLCETLSAVQPLVEESLPTGQQRLGRLRERLELAQSRIKDVGFKVLMERQRESLACAMTRHLH
jgi:hypothetical protein